MPRGRKRKHAASEHEPLADNITTTDGNTTRDVGGPDNSTDESGSCRTGNTTETADSSRAAGHSVGGTSNGERSSGSAGTGSGIIGPDSGGNSRGQPPTPLTRDIPTLVREISRQLRLDNAEVHSPLSQVLCCASRVSHLDASAGPVTVDTPGPGVHWSCG